MTGNAFRNFFHDSRQFRVRDPSPGDLRFRDRAVPIALGKIWQPALSRR